MPFAQKEEEFGAEEAKKKLAALTPIKVTKQAEESYGQAQKNAQTAMNNALSFFSLSKDPAFRDFLKGSEIGDIIKQGKASFEGSKVQFAYTGEDRKQIYSVRVSMNGEPPRTLTLTTGNDSVQLLLTDQNGTPKEHIMQKDSALRYSKFNIA